MDTHEELRHTIPLRALANGFDPVVFADALGQCVPVGSLHSQKHKARGIRVMYACTDFMEIQAFAVFREAVKLGPWFTKQVNVAHAVNAEASEAFAGFIVGDEVIMILLDQGEVWAYNIGVKCGACEASVKAKDVVKKTQHATFLDGGFDFREGFADPAAVVLSLWHKAERICGPRNDFVCRAQGN